MSGSNRLLVSGSALRPRGAVLVAVMICLAVAMVILATRLRAAVAERRQISRIEQDAQADWLAESAIARGASRLAAEPAYRGETWKLTPDELHARGTGAVVISVEDVKDQPRRRLVRVQASLGTEPTQLSRRSKQVLVSRAPAGE